MQSANREPFKLTMCNLDLSSVPTQLSDPSPSIDRPCTLQAGEEQLSNCVFCAGTGVDDARCLNNQGAAGGRFRWIIDTQLNVNMSDVTEVGYDPCPTPVITMSRLTENCAIGV